MVELVQQLHSRLQLGIQVLIINDKPMLLGVYGYGWCEPFEYWVCLFFPLAMFASY